MRKNSHAGPGISTVAAVIAVVGLATTASAQTTAAQDPNTGNVTVTATFDTVSTYMFRGIRQHATGIAMWPAVDFGVSLHASDEGLRSAVLNAGLWNSLNTGDTGTDGPSGKVWYESDFYSTLTLGFGGGTTVATTYTAYTSPNNSYSTVKELMVKLAVDDSAHLGKAALKPYAMVAFEIDTKPGLGQADGGLNAGRYLELGAGPGYAWPRAGLTVPVKVGLSLANYYEINTGTAAAPAYVDQTFGYFSVAGVITAPFGATTSFGAWNVHGGVEYQALGDTTKVLNGGDRSRVIGWAGIGVTY